MTADAGAGPGRPGGGGDGGAGGARAGETGADEAGVDEAGVDAAGAGAGGRIVIGVGNEFRRDDGVGPAVVEALRGRVDAVLAVTDGEPARLVELWAGAELAVVVDAVRAEAPRPGRIHELGLDTVATAGLGASGGSHALGLGEAVELGVAVDRMPRRLRVFAVEGTDFGMGPGLTEPVAAALEPLTERVAQALAAPAAGRSARAAGPSPREATGGPA